MFAFRIIILTFFFFNWRIYSLPITMPLGRPVQGPYLPGGVWELRGQVRPSVKAGAVSLRPAEKLQTRMLTASGLGPPVSCMLTSQCAGPYTRASTSPRTESS